MDAVGVSVDTIRLKCGHDRHILTTEAVITDIAGGGVPPWHMLAAWQNSGGLGKIQDMAKYICPVQQHHTINDVVVVVVVATWAHGYPACANDRHPGRGEYKREKGD